MCAHGGGHYIHERCIYSTDVNNSPADDVAVYPYCRALYRSCIALCVRYRGSLKGHGANEDRPPSQLYTHAKSSFYVHNECLLNRVSADYHFSYFAYLKKRPERHAPDRPKMRLDCDDVAV